MSSTQPCTRCTSSNLLGDRYGTDGAGITGTAPSHLCKHIQHCVPILHAQPNISSPRLLPLAPSGPDVLHQCVDDRLPKVCQLGIQAAVDCSRSLGGLLGSNIANGATDTTTTRIRCLRCGWGWCDHCQLLLHRAGEEWVLSDSQCPGGLCKCRQRCSWYPALLEL